MQQVSPSSPTDNSDMALKREAIELAFRFMGNESEWDRDDFMSCVESFYEFLKGETK